MYKDTISNSFKLGKVAKIVRDMFYELDYSEIFLPAMDRYSHELRGGLKTAFNNEFYVIKPDVTSHLLSSIIKEEELKVFYVSEVLDGTPKGTWQIGTEWIGGKKTMREKIIEQISTVKTILKTLGIADFMIDIGSLRKWRELIEQYGLDKKIIDEAIEKRSISAMGSMNIPEKARGALMALLQKRGKTCNDPLIDSIIGEVNDDCMMVDFGTLRHFDYYDDIVIEIYTRNHGKMLGGGGQYVNRGQDCFGFALDLGILAQLSSDSLGNGKEGDSN
ncbi:MAG: ATP phosphoribosyltransferase regulatory subunit [Thermotogota bacterium]|nr:ATP phosphoribosyltransferase regulatory subunit [Thermotogota bacterium]